MRAVAALSNTAVYFALTTVDNASIQTTSMQKVRASLTGLIVQGEY